jgi:hypothetical protein
MSNTTHSYLTTRAQIRDLLKECLTVIKNPIDQPLIHAIYDDIIWILDFKKKKVETRWDIMEGNVFIYTQICSKDIWKTK